MARWLVSVDGGCREITLGLELGDYRSVRSGKGRGWERGRTKLTSWNTPFQFNPHSFIKNVASLEGPETTLFVYNYKITCRKLVQLLHRFPSFVSKINNMDLHLCRSINIYDKIN
jgi:hypothetical protein